MFKVASLPGDVLRSVSRLSVVPEIVSSALIVWVEPAANSIAFSVVVVIDSSQKVVSPEIVALVRPQPSIKFTLLVPAANAPPALLSQLPVTLRIPLSPFSVPPREIVTSRAWFTVPLLAAKEPATSRLAQPRPSVPLPRLNAEPLPTLNWLAPAVAAASHETAMAASAARLRPLTARPV
jgi:hypothetical protein